MLRVKALQNLYAFSHCRKSDYFLTLDKIEEAFKPKWEEMDQEHMAILNDQKAKTLAHFKKNYSTENQQSDLVEDEPKVKDSVTDAMVFYRNQVRKDFQFMQKNMLEGTENIFNLYLLAMDFLLGFAEAEYLEKQEKAKKSGGTPDQLNLNLYTNKFVSLLKNNHELKQNKNQHKINWRDHNLEIRRWFRDLVRKSEVYLDYTANTSPDFIQDRDILIAITKKIIFKENTVNEFWEEKDLNWSENRSIVKSMVLKTLKSVDNEEGNLEIAELSRNWEDDKNFFRRLYEYTISNEREYESIVAEKIKNWDIDRVAVLDKLILMMAINEMIHFPSIPVKVTINEYIEISKLYSTPKSKQFVNGILDVLATQLTNDGTIRKSGRGLIDNK